MKVSSVICVAVVLCVPIHGRGKNDDADIAFSVGTGANFQFDTAKPTRYLLYEVNPGEGFNLRRDVYIRLANLVRALNHDESWTLVLPPWNRLYHWQSVVEQAQIPWGTFFDLDSFRRYIPVLEFVEFLNVTERRPIEEVYYLQRYKEGWKDGKWEEKMDVRECIEQHSFVQHMDGSWLWWFWDFANVTAKSFQCLSVQAEATYFKQFLLTETTARSVFLVRAEQLIHGQYSEWSAPFWTARRSMRFASHLRLLGDVFRQEHLNSTDRTDNTLLSEDWTTVKKKHGDAVGGPYIAVHLRRRDFLYSHQEDIPSLQGAVRQIIQALTNHSLSTVFIATDAPKSG